jgi:hypothetical protein
VALISALFRTSGLFITKPAEGEVMIKRDIVPPRSRRTSAPLAVTGCALLIAIWSFASSASAQQSDDARQVLKAMTDYVSSQKVISILYDTDIEVITNDLQKIQFASSGQMLLSRPDKVHASRMGGYADVEMDFDGKTFTVFGKNLNKYVQIDSAGSIDDLVAKLRNDFGVAVPGADLMLSGSYDGLMADVLEAKHIGRGVIDGVECDHLAFRNNDVDWQLWIEVGGKPIPRKYVITSKAVTAAPQYTLRIREWKTDVPVAADAFTFKPPADAQKVDISALADIDEVPKGVAPGAKK